MPVTLLVRPLTASGAAPPALTFDGNRVVIGRGESCDVRLPEPSVSTRHASIREANGAYSIFDEGSTNGTFVGGVKVPAHAARGLRSGELVRIGRVWIEVRVDQKPATKNLAVATRDLALFLVQAAMQNLDDARPKLRVVEGPDFGRELVLDDGCSVTVGRGEACDLPLADPDASREHVTVTRRGNVFTLRELGSKNGAWLGETALIPGRDTVWRPVLMLRLGRSVLAIHEPLARALADIERVADEVLPANASVPPPPSSRASLPSAPPERASAPPGAPLSAPQVPEGEAPQSIHASVATGAPIAEAAAGGPPAPIARAPKRKSAWTPIDVAVAATALVVAALSIAGLFWLLRG